MPLIVQTLHQVKHIFDALEKLPVENHAKRPFHEDEKSKRPNSTDSDESSNDIMERNFAKSKKAKTSPESEKYR